MICSQIVVAKKPVMYCNEAGENSPLLRSLYSHFLSKHTATTAKPKKISEHYQTYYYHPVKTISHKELQTSSSNFLSMTLFSEFFKEEQTCKHLSALFLNKNKKLNSK